MHASVIVAILHALASRHVSHGAERFRLAEQYAEIVEVAAARDGADPLLVTSVIRAESRFDPKAIGRDRRDIGWMQLRRGASTRLSVRALQDPTTNLREGVPYLLGQIKRCGGLLRGLGAYNSGHCGHIDYSRKVFRIYEGLRKEERFYRASHAGA